jgi:hypothetical protein
MFKVECSVLNASALPEVILVYSEVFKSTPLLASQLINGAFVLRQCRHIRNQKNSPTFFLLSLFTSFLFCIAEIKNRVGCRGTQKPYNKALRETWLPSTIL